MNAESFLSSFEQDVLDKLTDEGNKDIIMMGDFNADVIASKPCKYTRSLIHATRLHGLSQLVKEPTRVTEHTKTAIDLMFVNNLLSHMECKSLQPVIILLFLLSKKLVFLRLMRKFAK